MPAWKLNDKHYKLLELVKRNKFSIEELAAQTGITEQTVNNLLTGSPLCGEIGRLFQIELRKVDREVEARISRKTNLAREKLLNKLLSWVEYVGGGESLDTKTKHKCLVDAINALNKAMPYQVNIENYTWKDGMTTEEAVNEFKRIKAMAESASIRRRVQEFASRGAAEGIIPHGQADEGTTDSSDTILPAEPEAGIVPQEQSSGEGDIRGEQVSGR